MVTHFQLASSRDKLEKNVLHTLIVIKYVTLMNLLSVQSSVSLMDVSVQMEQ